MILKIVKIFLFDELSWIASWEIIEWDLKLGQYTTYSILFYAYCSGQLLHCTDNSLVGDLSKKLNEYVALSYCVSSYVTVILIDN